MPKAFLSKSEMLKRSLKMQACFDYWPFSSFCLSMSLMLSWVPFLRLSIRLVGRASLLRPLALFSSILSMTKRKFFGTPSSYGLNSLVSSMTILTDRDSLELLPCLLLEFEAISYSSLSSLSLVGVLWRCSSVLCFVFSRSLSWSCILRKSELLWALSVSCLNDCILLRGWCPF